MNALSPTAHQLRLAMRGVAATVTLLTTVTPEGGKQAMLASSFTSVTLEPPTVLVCIGRQTGIHASLLAAQRFCINVLHTDQRTLTQAWKQYSGAERFAHGDWGEGDGLPYLTDAQSVLFCTVGQQYEVGTHTVVIASVLRVLLRPEIAPLVYLDGQYGRVNTASAPAA